MNRAEEFLNKMPDELRSKAEKLIALLQSTQGIIVAMSALEAGKGNRHSRCSRRQQCRRPQRLQARPPGRH